MNPYTPPDASSQPNKTALQTLRAIFGTLWIAISCLGIVNTYLQNAGNLEIKQYFESLPVQFFIGRLLILSAPIYLVRFRGFRHVLAVLTIPGMLYFVIISKATILPTQWASFALLVVCVATLYLSPAARQAYASPIKTGRDGV